MCAFQVRKGFWKPPPQIWLGDVSKIRVLDPHFLHQTADRLLRIPLHPKSKQVREAVSFNLRTGCFGSSPHQIVALSLIKPNLISLKLLVCVMLLRCCSSLTFALSEFSHQNLLSCSFPRLPYLPFSAFALSLLPSWMLTRLEGASAD